MLNYESPFQWGMDTIDAEISNIHFASPENYLRDKVQETKCLIISEAHHKPQHRLFTKSLLRMLYDEGFRYFGLEALHTYDKSNFNHLMDSLINQRKYPLHSQFTGTYTLEPQMGNLIREALSIGFEIFGYEATHENRSRGMERDSAQAVHIIEFMNSHPEGKILIHCGYSHAIESSEKKYNRYPWMASHLKTLTGIDPLTIYQELLTEKLLETESPVFKKLDGKTSAILLDYANNPWQPEGIEHFDMYVYHPRTIYVHGRPDWLFRDGSNQPYFVNKDQIDLDYPIIIKAIRASEGDDAVPIDIIELKHRYVTRALALPKGKYRLSMMDRERMVQIIEIEVE